MVDMDLPDLESLVSAEDFLEYFGVEYDPRVVQVNRLHILQRFHDYLESAHELRGLAQDGAAKREKFTQLLTRAYHDFVSSDARTEKVFEVFRRAAPGTVFVPLDGLRK